MRKLWVLTNVSIDGYFEAPGHDISWASRNENPAFSPEGIRSVDTYLFGRRTYEMIRGFWSTPQAAEMAPDVAEVLNENPKIVVSQASYEPGWRYVTVMSGDVVGEVRKLKERPGKDIAMFGSNTLCVSLMQQGLIDEFKILVNPVALGEGTSLFTGLPRHVELALTESRAFESGAVLLTYTPAAR